MLLPLSDLSNLEQQTNVICLYFALHPSRTGEHGQAPSLYLRGSRINQTVQWKTLAGYLERLPRESEEARDTGKWRRGHHPGASGDPRRVLGSPRAALAKITIPRLFVWVRKSTQVN
jgi:hypothetical protein